MTEHYGGKDNPHEARKCLSAWGLTGNAYMWTVGKYLSRLDKKPGNSELDDLKKMKDYIDYRIEELISKAQSPVKTVTGQSGNENGITAIHYSDGTTDYTQRKTVREHDGVNTVDFRGVQESSPDIIKFIGDLKLCEEVNCLRPDRHPIGLGCPRR